VKPALTLLALLTACDFAIDTGAVDQPTQVDAGAVPECDAAWTCPVAADGRANICGSFVDRETAEPLAGADSTRCDPDDPAATGACSLRLATYDELRFLEDPDGAPSMASTIETDACGRFRALDVAVPVEGMLALVSSDAGGQGTWTQTSKAIELPPSRTIDDLVIPVTRTSTIDRWTTTAGEPFEGDTFEDTGVLVVRFVHGGQALAGVHAMVEGIQQHAYYFADTDPDTISTIDPELDATGPNGAALLISTDGKRHTGYGGEPDGCAWTSERGGGAETVVTSLTLAAACE
jgi:hypothetical protein